MMPEKTPEAVEDMSQHVEDLIFKGEATKTVELMEGKLKVVLTNLNGNDQLKIDTKMQNVKGTNAFILHTYQLWILAYTIKGFNEHSPETIESWFEFLKSQPSVIIDLLMTTQATFEKNLRQAITNNENIENFSHPASTEQG